MALVQVSRAQGRIPVTIFQLQDRVNLGNYTELEHAAREEYERGMRDLVIDLSQTPSLTSIGIRAGEVFRESISQQFLRNFFGFPIREEQESGRGLVLLS